MDETFKCGPWFLTHICQYNGHYIPTKFCLLQKQNLETYVYTFRQINNLLNVVSIQFLPKWVTIDFKMAIHKIVEVVWPTIEILDCRFHLTL